MAAMDGTQVVRMGVVGEASRGQISRAWEQREAAGDSRAGICQLDG